MTTGIQRKVYVGVVDDDVSQRKSLARLLRAAGMQPIAYASAEDFRADVRQPRFDCLVLDVQLPGISGIELRNQLASEGIATPVVFVTAYDEYAIRAFDIHAVDYLLKPFGAGRFETALQRARQRLGGKLPAPTELSSSARPPSQPLERIVVRDGTRVSIIPIAKLDYAEAQDDYIALAAEGKKHLKQQTISSLESALDPSRFLRIHRSYIVNLERVTKVEPYSKDNHVVVLSNGTQLPVSRSGYARLRQFLDQTRAK